MFKAILDQSVGHKPSTNVPSFCRGLVTGTGQVGIMTGMHVVLSIAVSAPKQVRQSDRRAGMGGRDCSHASCLQIV